MNKQLAIVAVVGLIIGGGIGYFGAHALAASSGSGARAAFARAGGMGTFTRGMGGMGANLLAGTVAALDSTSLTIDTRDGSSHVVLLSPTTSVTKNTTGSLTDVRVGSTVFITGTSTASGEVEASMINLR